MLRYLGLTILQAQLWKFSVYESVIVQSKEGRSTGTLRVDFVPLACGLYNGLMDRNKDTALEEKLLKRATFFKKTYNCFWLNLKIIEPL